MLNHNFDIYNRKFLKAVEKMIEAEKQLQHHFSKIFLFQLIVKIFFTAITSYYVPSH